MSWPIATVGRGQCDLSSSGDYPDDIRCKPEFWGGNVQLKKDDVPKDLSRTLGHQAPKLRYAPEDHNRRRLSRVATAGRCCTVRSLIPGDLVMTRTGAHRLGCAVNTLTRLR